MKLSRKKRFLALFMAFAMLLNIAGVLPFHSHAESFAGKAPENTIADVCEESVVPPATDAVPLAVGEKDQITKNIQIGNGANQYTLFNSGRGSGGTPVYRTPNPNDRSLNNSGYDIYASYSSYRQVNLGLSFTVSSEITDLGKLYIEAYDVDETQGERDLIYLYDETTGKSTQLSGYLSGWNSQWNTTVFRLDPSLFIVGHTYHFILYVSVQNWVVYVRSVNLELTSGLPQPDPEILEHNFTASISNSGLVSTSLYLKTNKDVTYLLEYAATSANNQYGSAVNQSINANSSGVTKNVNFQLQNGAPEGNYQIDVFLRDSNTNNVVVSYTVTTSGPENSTVNYDANGGSSNLPMDYNVYHSGDIVTVKFDYIPSKAGFVFLGWARSATATEPEFTKDGNNTFAIGSDDVTLYAVWANEHTHNYTEAIVTGSCIVQGYTLFICECGDSYKDNYTGYGPHNPGQWIIDQEPDCIQSGIKHTSCTLCETVLSNVYEPALGHDYITEVTREVTCTEAGIITHTCSRCGDSYETYIHPEHNYSVTDHQDATCTVDGYTTYTCSKCYESYQDIIPGSHNYVAEITIMATAASDGEITYTCTICGHVYTEVIPARPDAKILLVQDRLPWRENNNVALLNHMVSQGFISGWDMATTDRLTAELLASYGVVLIANDQYTSTYNNLSAAQQYLMQFANAGGVVIYGACDHGWAAGNIGYALPEGVTKSNYYSNYNYIVDNDHPVVTGVYTDGKSLSNALLQGTYCSHTAFFNLPENANVILQDGHGDPTLVEYPVGNGHIILSGLTWEFYYVRVFQGNTTYTKNVYDDLVYYALQLSDSCEHAFDAGSVVQPTCDAYGYTIHTCELCGATIRDTFVDPIAHIPGEWIVDQAETCTQSGMMHTSCTICGDVLDNVYIPAKGHQYVTDVTKEPTCTQAGIMTHICVNCGDSYITYLYAEHSYAITEHQEATCTVDGYITYTCSACKDSYQEIIPGGHNYIAEITKVANENENGIITYTCTICNHSYTEIIPARPDAKILLVQDRMPWTEDSNIVLLNRMVSQGFISGWDMTTSSNLTLSYLASYGVILIANDQYASTYNKLCSAQNALTQFAQAGGVVVYGACDHGWAGGNIGYTLPEGVTKSNYYSMHNYIVDTDHPIVTGVYTDGKPLSNTLLYGTYCSHTAFSNLPADANVLLQDGHGDPTLVEYALGDGHIILSGLTWEFYYEKDLYRNYGNPTYSKNVYDDLVFYALQLSNSCDHAYDEGVVIAPTCTQQGYTVHTCVLCGNTMKDNFTDALGHTRGQWVIVKEPSKTETGLCVVYCSVCGVAMEEEVMPMIDAPVVYVVAQTNPVIIGQTFDVYVIVEDCDPVKAAAIVPEFDNSIFQLVSAQWLREATIHTEQGEIAAAWASFTDINGDLIKLTFIANELSQGSLITVKALIQNNGLITLSVVGDNVSVIECPHENFQISLVDDTYHVSICTVCGYNVLSAHIFDHGCDTTCNECDYVREITHIEGELVHDDANHWNNCTVCGQDLNVEAHIYDNGCDVDCNVCGHVRTITHTPNDVWDYYENEHWLCCSVCGVIIETGEHVYDNVEDCDCNVCQFHRPKRGDLNGDNEIDSDDAIYLLWHTLFEDDYVLNQSGDMNGDGRINSDDAIYLLWHSFFGDRYYLYYPEGY